MYETDSKPDKGLVIRMDPDCAICHSPATLACDCESKGLEVAVKQAEDRMMRAIYTDIRTWVRGHAQDYILEYFGQLSERRKLAHSTHLDRLKAHAYYHYNAPPHPSQLAEAQTALKRGIDEDWRVSVQRYPEVLGYFYGLVELTLPADEDPTVKDPPLGSLAGHRKVRRRVSQSGNSGLPYNAPAITYRGEPEGLPPRTPPPPGRLGGRPAGTRGDRRSMPPYRSQTTHVEHAPYMPPF